MILGNSIFYLLKGHYVLKPSQKLHPNPTALVPRAEA